MMVIASDYQRVYLRPSADIFFSPFADGGVLFKKGTRRVWILNHTAAIIWCLLDQASDVEALTTLFSRELSIDLATAASDVIDVLDRFALDGLFSENPLPIENIADEAAKFFGGPKKKVALGRMNRHTFETAGYFWEFCCDNKALADDYLTLMGHLTTAVEDPLPQMSLGVLPDSGRKDSWEIILDGRITASACPLDLVLPHLLTLTFAAISHARADKLLFHAAVVKKGMAAILFPGETGSGKTTLAAFLARRGYVLFSDELAVLDVQHLTILSCPLPMSIKPGSVGVLSHYYPELPQLAVYTRADGKKIRYLLPPAESLARGSDVAMVGALVFPQFSANASDRLTPLDKAAALARLVKTGSSNRDLDPFDISAIIRLVENNPCFELIFSDIEEVGHLLEKEVFSCSSVY